MNKTDVHEYSCKGLPCLFLPHLVASDSIYETVLANRTNPNGMLNESLSLIFTLFMKSLELLLNFVCKTNNRMISLAPFQILFMRQHVMELDDQCRQRSVILQ